MNHKFELGSHHSDHRDPPEMTNGAKNGGDEPGGPVRGNGAPREECKTSGEPSTRPLEVWNVIELFARHWRSLTLAGAAMGAVGLLLGLAIWKTSYIAQTQLIRYDSPTAVEVLKPRLISPLTFASVLHAPEILQRVGAKADPPIPPEALAASVRVTPERNADIVAIAVAAKSPTAAVDLANLYANEAVRHTGEVQAKEAREASEYLKQQLAQTEQDIRVLNDQLSALSHSPTQSLVSLVPGLLPRPPLFADELQAARKDLALLRARYQDAHPLVKEQQAKVKALEMLVFPNGNLPSAVTPSDASPASDGLPRVAARRTTNEVQALDLESIRMRLQALEVSRLDLAHRQRAAQDFTENPPGFYRVFAPAMPQEVVRQSRRFKVVSLSAFFGLIGAAGAAGLILFSELTDRRIKNMADIRRITRLPLLATLGDLRQMSQTAETDWAFRTWTLLQGKLCRSPNHGLVCGIISSGQGEGRSTWVNLLAQAAGQLGFRVLTIATQPSPARAEAAEQTAEKTGEQTTDDSSEPGNALALARSVLASPTQVTQKLVGQEQQPHVHIPLPGWVWDLGRRKQWQGALNHWRKIDNIVILVELPPASVPEGVLLAQNLPNLVWLAGSGKADAADTREQLETLRHARCNLVGAVLNRAPDPLLKNRFSRWLGCAALCLALNPTTGKTADAGLPAQAADAAQAETNLVLAGSTATKRGAWQERLTLGPGDVLTFSLFGRPELTRKEVPIGPDGRVGYLEAQNILASGLTIDELRVRLDAELAEYRRAARTIITPEAFRSKKFFVLGTVVRKGVFTLDRPMTIIEAIAQGRGLETGLFDHGTRELADLQHSFLVRQGKRVPVDLQKLFQEGDLSQNVPLEPDDYLFFPPTSHGEVYVLGEVKIPGIVGLSGDLTAIGAITARGGFTERAWKKKVLVVRGSLNRPEKFVVDTAAVLSASVPDFRLQPKDIVYVSSRPWIKAEELVDAAAAAFVQSAVIIWTGQNVNP